MFFLKYVRQYVKLILVLLLFSGIFLLVFSLYDLETEAVFYAAALCIILGVLFLGIGSYRYWKKLQQLFYVNKNILYTVNDMPKPFSMLEKEYQNMLLHLMKEYQELNTAQQMQRNDSMDYYTAWIHQIKAPIAVMRLVLQSEDRNDYQELLYELFRIEQYTEMVLSYFRLDSNSNDFVFMEYPLDDIIRQAVRKYASQFVRRRIGLKYEGTDSVVLSDRKWLGFIMEQLLSNALKYTAKGTITISVEDQQLTILDTGIGISPEDLPRIFEKGFTGYNGRSDKKSTGLGLYLCKQAADKLSHRMSVRSEVGKGTCVSIHLSHQELNVE